MHVPVADLRGAFALLPISRGVFVLLPISRGTFTLLSIFRGLIYSVADMAGAFALLPICLTVHFPRNSWYNNFCICDPLKEGEERENDDMHR